MGEGAGENVACQPLVVFDLLFLLLIRSCSAWVPVGVCHSTVLAVKISAARLIKGNAEDSGAAPVGKKSEIQKQIKIHEGIPSINTSKRIQYK